MSLSALGGVTTLNIAGSLNLDKILNAFLIWLMGDTLGVLLIVPFYLAIINKKNYQLDINWIEIVIWILVALGVSYLSLSNNSFNTNNSNHFVFLDILLVIWAGFRFGFIGGAIASLFFSVAATFSTASGHGVFYNESSQIGLLNLWIFNASTVVSGMMMATIQAKQRKAENEIKEQNEELIKLHSEKDKFIAIMAHDLRSPLTAIAGFSELLNKSIDEMEYDEIGEFSEMILKSSRLSLDLISNLMQWTLAQSGRINFNPENMDLNQIINNNIQLLNLAAQQKSITIETDLLPNSYVYVDEGMTSTILRNLISNAIKFTKSDGKILISTSKDQDKYVVSIKDWGVGMPQSVVDKLFAIDSNHSTLGTFGEQGTGLGLILCKELVNNQSGKIWVESKEDVGSTFYFTLPRSQGI